jgi:hypothetical protein
MIDFLNLLWGALTGQFRSRVSLEAQSWFFGHQLDVLSRKPRPCVTSPAQQQGFVISSTV